MNLSVLLAAALILAACSPPLIHEATLNGVEMSLSKEQVAALRKHWSSESARVASEARSGAQPWFTRFAFDSIAQVESLAMGKEPCSDLRLKKVIDVPLSIHTYVDAAGQERIVRSTIFTEIWYVWSCGNEVNYTIRDDEGQGIHIVRSGRAVRAAPPH